MDERQARGMIGYWGLNGKNGHGAKEARRIAGTERRVLDDNDGNWLGAS